MVDDGLLEIELTTVIEVGEEAELDIPLPEPFVVPLRVVLRFSLG